MYKSWRIESCRRKGRINGTVHEIIWASRIWQCTSNIVCSILWVSNCDRLRHYCAKSGIFSVNGLCVNSEILTHPCRSLAIVVGYSRDIYCRSWLLGTYIGYQVVLGLLGIHKNYLVVFSYNWFWFWVGSGTLGSVTISQK